MLLFWIFCDILSLNVKMYLRLKLYTVPFFVSGQTYTISKGSNHYSTIYLLRTWWPCTFTAVSEIRKFVAMLHWETSSLNWRKILSRSLAERVEPRPILACKGLSIWWYQRFILNLDNCPHLLPVKLLIVKPSRRVLPVSFPVLFCLCPNFFWVLQVSHSVVFYIYNHVCQWKTRKMFPLYFSVDTVSVCLNFYGNGVYMSASNNLQNKLIWCRHIYGTKPEICWPDVQVKWAKREKNYVFIHTTSELCIFVLMLEHITL